MISNPVFKENNLGRQIKGIRENVYLGVRDRGAGDTHVSSGEAVSSGCWTSGQEATFPRPPAWTPRGQTDGLLLGSDSCPELKDQKQRHSFN